MPEELNPLAAGVEGAKALQEMAKAASKAMDLSEKLGGFFGRVFGPAADELGQTLGERARFWRFLNALNVFEKAKKITASRSVPDEMLKILPFSDALRLVEAFSQEEDNAVQNLWARLMANAVDPNFEVKAKKVYIELLKSFSSSEAAFTDLIWQCEGRSYFRTKDDVSKFNGEMNELAERSWRKFSEFEQKVALQNLVRLRCITFRGSPIDLTGLFAALPSESNFGTKWAAADPEKFRNILNSILHYISLSAGVVDHNSTNPINLGRAGFSAINVPEMNFTLTPLGRDLMAACRQSVESEEPAVPT